MVVDSYFDLAAAAALSAFEVPGLFLAELKLPKRLVGLGAMMLALGRAAVAVVALASCPVSCGRLAVAPLAIPVLPGFEGFLVFEVTTIRLAAGCTLPSLLSPSRGRFEPAASTRDPLVVVASGVVFLLGESSLDPCLRFVDEAALSRILFVRPLTL